MLSQRQKKFWVILTLIALSFVATKWIGDRSTTRYRSCKKSCQVVEIPRQAIPHINEINSVDREPVVKNLTDVTRRIQYSYSCASRRAGLSGTVVARVLVDQKGDYLRHRIISRTNNELSHRSDRFLRCLKFEPAIKSRRPVPAWVDVEVSIPY